MVNVVICSRQEFIHSRITELCKAYGKIYHIAYEFYHFVSEEEICLFHIQPDIIILEIGQINLSEAEAYLKENNIKPYLLFVVNQEQNFQEEILFQKYGWIFQSSLQEQFSSQLKQIMLFLKVGQELCLEERGRKVFLNSKKVLYIESERVYSIVYSMQGQYLVRKTLNKWEKELMDPAFYRLSRSYVINMEWIEKISYHYIKIGQKKITIPRRRKKQFQKEYEFFCDREINEKYE